jgi:hypothetical protein
MRWTNEGLSILGALENPHLRIFPLSTKETRLEQHWFNINVVLKSRLGIDLILCQGLNNGDEPAPVYQRELLHQHQA